MAVTSVLFEHVSRRYNVRRVGENAFFVGRSESVRISVHDGLLMLTRWDGAATHYEEEDRPFCEEEDRPLSDPTLFDWLDEWLLGKYGGGRQ